MKRLINNPSNMNEHQPNEEHVAVRAQELNEVHIQPREPSVLEARSLDETRGRDGPADAAPLPCQAQQLRPQLQEGQGAGQLAAPVASMGAGCRIPSPQGGPSGTHASVAAAPPALQANAGEGAGQLEAPVEDVGARAGTLPLVARADALANVDSRRATAAKAAAAAAAAAAGRQQSPNPQGSPSGTHASVAAATPALQANAGEGPNPIAAERESLVPLAAAAGVAYGATENDRIPGRAGPSAGTQVAAPASATPRGPPLMPWQ